MELEYQYEFITQLNIMMQRKEQMQIQNPKNEKQITQKCLNTLMKKEAIPDKVECFLKSFIDHIKNILDTKNFCNTPNTAKIQFCISLARLLEANGKCASVALNPVGREIIIAWNAIPPNQVYRRIPGEIPLVLNFDVVHDGLELINIIWVDSNPTETQLIENDTGASFYDPKYTHGSFQCLTLATYVHNQIQALCRKESWSLEDFSFTINCLLLNIKSKKIYISNLDTLKIAVINMWTQFIDNYGEETLFKDNIKEWILNHKAIADLKTKLEEKYIQFLCELISRHFCDIVRVLNLHQDAYDLNGFTVFIPEHGEDLMHAEMRILWSCEQRNIEVTNLSTSKNFCLHCFAVLTSSDLDLWIEKLTCFHGSCPKLKSQEFF
jgi:hypothetical protein